MFVYHSVKWVKGKTALVQVSVKTNQMASCHVKEDIFSEEPKKNSPSFIALHFHPLALFFESFSHSSSAWRPV